MLSLFLSLDRLRPVLVTGTLSPVSMLSFTIALPFSKTASHVIIVILFISTMSPGINSALGISSEKQFLQIFFF
jgi:hypothetical protein